MTPPPTDDERRGGSRRKDPIDPIRVFEDSTGDFLGRVQDFNQTGMCLVTDIEDPAVGDEMAVMVQGPGVDADTVSLKATVRWIKPAAHEGYNELGLEFDLHLSEAAASTLARLSVLHCK